MHQQLNLSRDKKKKTSDLHQLPIAIAARFPCSTFRISLGVHPINTCQCGVYFFEDPQYETQSVTLNTKQMIKFNDKQDHQCLPTQHPCQQASCPCTHTLWRKTKR